MIINEYWPGDGIRSHVDLAKFEDGIVSLSLGSTCTMRFRQVLAQGDNSQITDSKDRKCVESRAKKRQRRSDQEIEKPGTLVDVLLRPGDLLSMSGDARYRWSHEIPSEFSDIDPENGEELMRLRRVSITLRKLKPDS